MSQFASQIGGLGSANSVERINKTRDTGGGFAELSSEEFTRIMIEELTNQDPFEPNDTQALLEQVSGLMNIESQSSLQDSLEALTLQSSLAYASGMIGKQIEGLDLNNDPITGMVESIRVVEGKAQLELDNGTALPLDRVTRITPARPDASAAAAATSAEALAASLQPTFNPNSTNRTAIPATPGLT